MLLLNVSGAVCDQWHSLNKQSNVDGWRSVPNEGL